MFRGKVLGAPMTGPCATLPRSKESWRRDCVRRCGANPAKATPGKLEDPRRNHACAISAQRGALQGIHCRGRHFSGGAFAAARLHPGVAPFDLYRALRQVNPSPYLYFLRMGETQILGSSPEMLVRVTGRKLEYRPIAGTHPRGRDEAEDLRLEEQMRNDEKERAEHVMLVDLGRNDLGRVSEYGSVKVKDLMYVERYSHVMHLVSALEGTLRKDLGALDAFAACFPAGTLSGAPEGPRHADHRRTGTGAPRHLWRIGALRRFCREPGFLHRHSHHAHAGQARVLAGGSRDRGGFRSGARI